jgi:UPF0716 protein FxsA
MFPKLIALFVLIPLAELAILVYLGTVIGPWYTILIVVVTGLAGAVLARSQGLATLARIRGNVERGILPSAEIFNGALILLGGLLLLTPGLMTDAVGLALLVPWTRSWVGGRIRHNVEHRIERGEIRYWEIR